MITLTLVGLVSGVLCPAGVRTLKLEGRPPGDLGTPGNKSCSTLLWEGLFSPTGSLASWSSRLRSSEQIPETESRFSVTL